MLKDHGRGINLLVRVVDILLVVGLGLAAYKARFPQRPLSASSDYHILILGVALAVLTLFPLFGLYRSWRGRGLWHTAGALLSAWATVLLLLMAFMWAFKVSAQYSRLWLGHLGIRPLRR